MPRVWEEQCLRREEAMKRLVDRKNRTGFALVWQCMSVECSAHRLPVKINVARPPPCPKCGKTMYRCREEK